MESQDNLRKMNATTLLEQMKALRGNAWKDVWQTYIPVMKEYIHNYDKKELLDISTGTRDKRAQLKNMDMSEHIVRNNNARVLLSLIIPSVSAFVCVTLEINGFNFAYVYILVENKNIKPIFISVGGNLVSSDGEWRSHIADIGSYNIAIAKYSKAIDTLYDAMSNSTTPNTHLFYSSEITKDITDQIHRFIDVEKYHIRLLTLSWFTGKYAQHMNILQHHVSSEFINLLVGDVNVIDVIGKTSADGLYDAIGSTCGCVYSKPEMGATYATVRTGQKLIQLTPDEVSHPLDTSFQTWNEIITTWQTMDLILNFISPSFVMQGGWFFVYNVNKSIFNLPTSHSRIELSDTIRLTPDDMRSDRVLSDVAVCMINEHVGRTFIDMLNRADTSVHMLEFGERYIFDIVYALYCFNTKMHKMHGDFHGNNATIARFSNIPDTDDSFVVYHINKDDYVWPHRGMYGCIIDFSRVMNLDNPEFVEHILSKYEIHFKSFTSINDSKIVTFVTSALDDSKLMNRLVKTATAFDIFEFVSSVLVRCADTLKDSSLKKMLTSIKSDTEHILLSITNDDDEKIDDVWANWFILNKYFKPSLDLPEIQKIKGHFNYNNKLLYSAEYYEKLPPSISVSPMIRNDHDKPVNTYSSFSSLIKTRYKLLEVEERILRGF